MQIFIILFSIAILIILITKIKLDPFISILLVSLCMGLALGQSPLGVTTSVIKGNGDLLGELSLILALGAMLGTLFEKSGAAEVIAEHLVRTFGLKGVQWATLVAGMCISFSLFFDVAFILLIPITVSLAKQIHINSLWVGIPAAIGILTVHVIFPPQAGSIMLIDDFNLSIVKVVVLGLVIAIPTAVVGGVLFTKLTLNSPKFNNDNTQKFMLKATATSDIKFREAIGILLLPVILITLPSILENMTSVPIIVKSAQLLSNPVIALLVTLLLAVNRLGLKQRMSMLEVNRLMSNSLKNIAAVLMINGSAGGLNKFY